MTDRVRIVRHGRFKWEWLWTPPRHYRSQWQRYGYARTRRGAERAAARFVASLEARDAE